MSESQLPTQYVKRGMWVNRENGVVFGSIITTDTRTGTFVVALLAVITTFGATHLWNLIVFFCHQMRARGHASDPRLADGLHRQQQALLRTQPTSSALVSEWLKLWWAWRRRVKRPFLRSLPQLLLGILFTIATLAVSLSTSYIVSGVDGVQVLVQSPLCGPTETIFERKNGSTNPAGADYTSGILTAAVNYAKDCYSEGTVPHKCTAFIRPRIKSSRERVACPFQRDLCAKIGSPAVALDSFVDLNSDLGMNLPSRDRVKFRRKTTCGLINTAGRYAFNETADSTQLYLGKRKHSPNNWTIQSLEAEKTTVKTFGRATFMKYGTSRYTSIDTLSPIAGMDRNGTADLTQLIFMPNAITYERPVNDPLFSAHKTMIKSTLSGVNFTYYAPDDPFLVMGCEVQYQYCYARPSSEDYCTGFGPIPDLLQVTPNHYPGASDVQLSAIRLLIKAGLEFDLETASRDLKATSTLKPTGSIPSLPDDQWIREVTWWDSIIWTAVQMQVADYAIGIAARVPSAADYQKKPVSKGDKRLCGMQRMQSPGGFVNISVFGLVFTLVLCGLAFLVDVLLLRFLTLFKNFRDTPRTRAWIQDGIYQLHRRAYEAHGEGIWERLNEEIPVTRSDGELGELPIESLPVHFKNVHSCCVCPSHVGNTEASNPKRSWTGQTIAAGGPNKSSSVTSELERDKGLKSSDSSPLKTD